MKLNEQGYKLIMQFEGLKLKAYLCPTKIWTIGYGNTYFPDGIRVSKGDVITKEYAFEIFKVVADDFALKCAKYIKSNVTQNQFNALVSFAYNVGVTNLKNSTLLKRVNVNPNDAMIAKEFLKWNRAGGQVLNGLTNRRIAESSMYFSKL